MAAWEDKCHHSKRSPSFFFLPGLYAEHDIKWYGISLQSAGTSWLSCVPSQFFVHPPPPPACWLVSWCKKQERPWCCANTAQKQWKHSRVIHTAFSTNLKHSPILATTKKINSTSTTSRYVLCSSVSHWRGTWTNTYAWSDPLQKYTFQEREKSN